MRFDNLVNEVLTRVSTTKFNKVITHDYESKVRVKQIQNEFILSKVASRDPSEIMFGVVGNAEGLEAHLQEYKELGFNNIGQIFIFENQPETFSKLKRRAKSLGIDFIIYRDPNILTDPKAVNSLKLYEETLHIDLKQNIYPTVISKLIPHITHLDFDVVGRAPDANVFAQSIQEYFTYPATKSIVVVCAMSRARGGSSSENVKEVNRVFEEILKTVCVYRDNRATAENTLEYFISQMATNVYTSSMSQTYQIKNRIKELVSISLLGSSPIKVYLEDLSNSIKAIGNISAKIIPYRGLSNMVSVVAAKSNGNDCTVDYSLLGTASQNTKSVSAAADTIKYLFSNSFGNNIYEKSTGKRISQYIVDACTS